MASEVIEKVRKLVTEGGMSRSGLARAAGLHSNTLRDCTEADWNPTAETLAKLEKALFSNDDRDMLVPIEEIIDEARNGRMFILVDDEDRENEGDLVIPAQMATPAAINFMATHGRGLICLTLTGQRVEELGLNLMSRNNGTRHETAFTVSIEAREGVTTGISAGDRARTVSVAIDGTKGQADIVTPGHVFPLRARDGGVLVRAGHDLKIGTIRDLIAYRRKHDHMVVRVSERNFTSRWGGDWKAICLLNRATGDETFALVKGTINPAEPTLVRMHALSLFDDLFGENNDRANLLSRSMELIGEAGSGVIVAINRPMSRTLSKTFETAGAEHGHGSEASEELRDYGVGAQVLAELGIHDMILLTNSHHSLVALEGYGINIVGERRIELA